MIFVIFKWKFSIALLSSKMWLAWRDVSKKACGVIMKPCTQKQPQVKKEPCRVLDM